MAMLMDIEKFEKDMAVFSFNQHQDVLTYLARLEATDWTVEDAKRWVEGEKKRLVSQEEKGREWTKLSFECPLCSAPMRLLPINFTPATLTGEDSKSVWLCSKASCMNTIYNKESIEEIAQQNRKGGT